MGDSVPPYPVGGYGDHGPAPPPAGFYMGYQANPNQPVMYQPSPGGPPQQPVQMTAYGGKYREDLDRNLGGGGLWLFTKVYYSIQMLDNR